MTNTRILFLDWSGTISSSRFWGHLENPKHSQNYIYQKTQSTLFGTHKHLIDPWMRGNSTSEYVISEVANIAGIEYQKLYKLFVDSCQIMQFDTTNLVSYVSKIRNSGIKVVIATDNMDSFQRWTVPALKLNSIFDDILDSYTVKSLKRDFDKNGNSLFFDEYLKKQNIKASDCTLIDDSVDRDGRLSSYGLNYLRLEPEIGLDVELERFIKNSL